MAAFGALTALSWLRFPLYAVSGITALASGGVYWFQNELIYPRNIPADARTNFLLPSSFPGLDLTDWEELTLPTPDGEKLNALLIRPSNRTRARPVTVITFHGNAGNIGHRIPVAGLLQEHYGANVLMLEYRGYGASTGTPNEKGLNIDAQTGLDFVRQRPELKDTKIVIYGQSLGGAVSLSVVARNQAAGDIKALVLENTFLSIKAMIPSVLPAARYLTPLCHQHWESEELIPKINIPVLFLSGLKDEIVPPQHMKRLYELCTSSYKEWKAFPDGTHNDTVAKEGYFTAIAQFLEKHVSK